MRIQQLLLEQVAGHLFQPLRLNAGNATAKQAGGFHQLGGHNPAPRFLHQMGAWMGKKLDAPGSQVLASGALAFELAANIAK